jgi:hypothetical protein
MRQRHRRLKTERGMPFALVNELFGFDVSGKTLATRLRDELELGTKGFW